MLSDTFGIAFSEHMIEYTPYEAGLAMLSEYFHVMRPGGGIRLVTPDFHAIAALCDTPWSTTQQPYFEFFHQHVLPKGQPVTAGSLANAMFRSWGHSFICDEQTLTVALESVGFTDVLRTKLCESAHPELRTLENEERYPPGLLD